MNGLELETVALTSLNQSDISVFDPSNHFDAEGLTLIVKETEERRKLRNQIENETKVQIKLRDFEAEQRVIEIDRDLEYVRIDQTRDIETKKAQQAAAIEAERATSQIAITQSRARGLPVAPQYAQPAHADWIAAHCSGVRSLTTAATRRFRRRAARARRLFGATTA